MLTADYEYSRSNRENLPQPIQMQLSKNILRKIYSIFETFIKFWTFWKNKEKDNEFHGLRISEIIDSERRSYLNA